MLRFIIILFAVTLLPSLAVAKRAAPGKVEPIVYLGTKYTAPNNEGRRAYIEAWDVQANKKLWDLTVFTNRIDPKIEEDVQWVFISSLKIQDGRLVITSDSGKIYQVDLKKKTVIQAQRPNTALEPTADSAFGLTGSAGFATRQFGGGSAFGR